MATSVPPISSSVASSAPLGRSAVAAGATAVLLIVVGFVLKALGSFEQPLSTAMNALHRGLLGTVGSALYRDFGPAPAIVGTVVITAVILVVRRDLRVASTFAFTVAVTWLSVAVVKLLVDRPRPDATVMPFPYTPVQHDASYPSGHATFIVVIVIALVALAPRRLRPAATVLGAILVASACFLLVVDGVHWTTDVLASVCWGLGVGPFVRAFWVRLVLPRAQFLTPKRTREQNAHPAGDPRGVAVTGTREAR
jgi:membrane-associated phospholipid phosphatase